MFTRKTLRKMYPGERKLAEACNTMELEVRRMKRLIPVIHDIEMASVAMRNMETDRLKKLADQDHGPGCAGPLNCTCPLTEGINTWPDQGDAVRAWLDRPQESGELTFSVEMTQEQYEAWQRTVPPDDDIHGQVARMAESEQSEQ